MQCLGWLMAATCGICCINLIARLQPKDDEMALYLLTRIQCMLWEAYLCTKWRLFSKPTCHWPQFSLHEIAKMTRLFVYSTFQTLIVLQQRQKVQARFFVWVYTFFFLAASIIWIIHHYISCHTHIQHYRFTNFSLHYTNPVPTRRHLTPFFFHFKRLDSHL